MSIGVFSFSTQTINCFSATVLDTPVHIRIETITKNLARIYLTDVQGSQILIPKCVGLRDLHNDDVPTYHNEFFITWFDSYVLSNDGVDIIWLTNQKNHAFATADGLSHFVA